MDKDLTPRSKPLTQSLVHTTPSARLTYSGSSLTPKQKEHVDSADALLNQRCCLIENHPNDHSVQYCHMVARYHTKNEDMMELLEWYWNMRHKTLHLSTRYNVFFAGAGLHLHHDNNAWGLLPDEAIIDQYYDSLVNLDGIRIARRKNFPEIKVPEGGFEYRFIPLGKSLERYRIVRQHDHALPPNKDQYTLHFYPFDTLPPLRSHLHPKFAIIELGRKYHELLDKDSNSANEAASSYPTVNRIYALYAAWTLSLKTMPEFREWVGQNDMDRDEDRQSESSSRTGYDSWRQGTKRRRTGRAAEQGSPTPAGKNSDVMQMADSSSETLSYETLVEHDHIHGKGGWTQGGLSGWAADACKHVTA